jgi:hypothetical protein
MAQPVPFKTCHQSSQERMLTALRRLTDYVATVAMGDVAWRFALRQIYQTQVMQLLATPICIPVF